jgi:hypothetical protein
LREGGLVTSHRLQAKCSRPNRRKFHWAKRRTACATQAAQDHQLTLRRHCARHRRAQWSSLRRSFCFDQFRCSRPGQLIVGRGSPWPCRPATLLQVLTLFPASRNLLQDCQICFCIAVLQEFRNAERRKHRYNCVASLLGCKLVRGSAGHPTAPRKSDYYRRHRADNHSLNETSARLATRPILPTIGGDERSLFADLREFSC